MPDQIIPPRRSEVKIISPHSLREALVSALRRWNRSQAFRIVAASRVAWVGGSLGIALADLGNNVAFDPGGMLSFTAWVILFSGLDNPPKTHLGKVFAMVLLGTGVGLAGLFTGTVASVLVEHQLRRRDVSS